MQTPHRLRGKSALVTGAGTGIGRAIAVRLAGEGAEVAVCALDMASATRTAAGISDGGGLAAPFAADVTDPAAVARLVEQILERFGKIDVLVNNAGINSSQRLFDVTPDEWDRVLSVNARGTFLCLQETARHMRNHGGGRIINIASIAAKGFRPTVSIPYAASKAAVVAMTRLGAEQLARHNITVNAICPGPTRTDALVRMIEGYATEKGVSIEEAYRAYDAHIPIGRSNDPEDIAAMAAFLASDDARNITGQSYNVDGGLIWD